LEKSTANLKAGQEDLRFDQREERLPPYSKNTMPANAETQALMEKALQHLLNEQSRVLKHQHARKMIKVAQALGDLATQTWNLLSQGLHKAKVRSVDKLTKQAVAIERTVDDISEQNWFYLNLSVSSIFQRVKESLAIQPIQERLNLKASIAVRNHFHNIRLLLLEQLLNARMLINNNDYGTETERVWQQFLQRELGPEFRVLQGGHVIDYAGNDANAQIDLVIVPADANVMTPSSSEGGKVNVFCDQVIAAIMTTSILGAKKVDEDWRKLMRVSELFTSSDELPGYAEQAWPLCYIIAGQSAPISQLKDKWRSVVTETPDSKFVPQFIISLDSGYLYSGATTWPRPRYPSNDVSRDEIVSEEGIYAGLGIAWLLTQIRARAKLIQNKPHGSIQRFMKLLDDATLKSATPPTWSPRFDKFGSCRPIDGVLHWGNRFVWVHNRLYLQSLWRDLPQLKFSNEKHFFRAGVDTSTLSWDQERQYLRWFRHATHWAANGLVALEEWTKNNETGSYTRTLAVFDAATGEELKAALPPGDGAFDDVKAVLESLRPSS
jgi:hypothetical protein